jgi:hypothetical protein
VYLQGKLKRLHQADFAYATSGLQELAGVRESTQGRILRVWSTIDGLSIASPQGWNELAPLNRNQLFAGASGWRVILTRLSSDVFAWNATAGFP